MSKKTKFWLSKLVFYVNNDPNLSIFLLKNIILGAHFLLWIFFENFNSKQLYFLKWRPIFGDLYSTNLKTWKLISGLVVGFGPKWRPGIVWDSPPFNLHPGKWIEVNPVKSNQIFFQGARLILIWSVWHTNLFRVPAWNKTWVDFTGWILQHTLQIYSQDTEIKRASVR